MIAHELRTPLGGIIGLAAMLLDTTLDSSQRATVHTIRTAAEHLAAVVGRLSPARGTVGNEPTLVPFDPAVLATTVARLLEPQAAAKGLTLAVVGHRNLPTLVSGDPVALRQVLVNLVTNAVRVTDEGSVTVRVRPERGAPTLRFEVSDTGPGLTPTLATAVHGDQRPGGGFGLRISRELVEGMGGELHAAPNAGQGATVWCTIPCAIVTSTTTADSPRRNLARVLVAVDDDVNAQVALSLLERLGYGVDLVASGTDALRAWGTRPYDLVLVDQYLPDLDGLQVARCVRELERADGRHITILGLTAGNQPADRERCGAAGMDGTLPKPIELRSLLALLARFSPPTLEPPPDAVHLVGRALVAPTDV